MLLFLAIPAYRRTHTAMGWDGKPGLVLLMLSINSI